jgi:hypothetical protein
VNPPTRAVRGPWRKWVSGSNIGFLSVLCQYHNQRKSNLKSSIGILGKGGAAGGGTLDITILSWGCLPRIFGATHTEMESIMAASVLVSSLFDA